MSETEPKTTVDLILEKLKGQDLPHVPERERRAAVERTVRMVGIDASSSVRKLKELIDMHEEQLDVHEEPSD